MFRRCSPEINHGLLRTARHHTTFNGDFYQLRDPRLRNHRASTFIRIALLALSLGILSYVLWARDHKQVIVRREHQRLDERKHE